MRSPWPPPWNGCSVTPSCGWAPPRAPPARPRGASTPRATARERAAVRANGVLETALARGGPFDLVYERYSLWSFAAMEYARATGTTGLLEVNAPLVEEQAAHRALVDRGAAEAVAERAFGAGSAPLAGSRPPAAGLAGQAPAPRARPPG